MPLGDEARKHMQLKKGCRIRCIVVLKGPEYRDGVKQGLINLGGGNVTGPPDRWYFFLELMPSAFEAAAALAGVAQLNVAPPPSG
jgi:hypothetical protein